MPATIKQIAEKLGVDPSTVSRALSGSPLISETTRVRVVQAAEELNYAPNLWAQNLAGTSAHLFGCLILELTNPFFVPMVRAIEDIADEHGYLIFLGESRRNLEIEKHIVERFRRVRAAGVIVTPVSSDLSHLYTLEEEGVNVVIVGRRDPGFDSINVNNGRSGFLVGRHLSELGHSRLGYVFSGDPHNTPESGRMAGLHMVLENNRLPAERLYAAGNNRIDGGGVAAELWAKDPQRPTAVFCSNDLLAMGFIMRVTEMGFSVPEDVSVVGHDDIPFADLFKMPLTTINFPKDEMGRLAARILLERTHKRGGGNWQPKNIVLEPELVRRFSSAELKR